MARRQRLRRKAQRGIPPDYFGYPPRQMVRDMSGLMLGSGVMIMGYGMFGSMMDAFHL